MATIWLSCSRNYHCLFRELYETIRFFQNEELLKREVTVLYMYEDNLLPGMLRRPG